MVFKQAPKDFDRVSSEREILKFWENTKAFDLLRRKNAGKPRWSFLDGPITANNPMGVHHAWGRTIKDCYQRYYAMTGHELRYQNGFDCQGLWVEVEVEKELGVASKREIEQFGLEAFINKCKERVNKFSKIQTDQSIRLGYWMDWDNSYYTMADENNYTIWTFLKKCHERGLLYKGLDAMPWCSRCGTGISEQERREGYRKVVDAAVYVKFPLKDRNGEYLLVWTTTPWTLAANVGAAVNPELTYAKVTQKGETFYLVADRVAVMKESGPFEVVETFPGERLLGWEYRGPFDDLPAVKPHVGAHRVIAWKDVSATDGTGIVHIAPGCGKEDFDLGKELKLPVIIPIDDAGLYIDGFGFLSGQAASAVAHQVFDELRKRDMYYKKENYEHDYPHCWRCATPLLFRAVDEWFINMSWRDQIVEVAKKITWHPGYGLDLEIDWLRNMHDWMISKKRFWGLALPIYECQCGWFDVIGSKQELQERAVEGWNEFDGHSPHRPWVDAVKIRCGKCGSLVSRIKDVGNPWLDAGIVPYSTVKYSSDRDYWGKWIPADLVLECFPGQFRNWFYALLSMSTMMENIPPFKELLGHALVRDEHGEEMHKSAGNAIWFDEAVDKMSADVMRWLFCRQNPSQNLNFGYNLADQVKRRVFNTWMNVYNFFLSYAAADEFDPRLPLIPWAERQDLDRWIMSRTQELIALANESLARFDAPAAVASAENLIESLSTWFVRRSRKRFWRPKDAADTDKLAAYQTLHEVLVLLAKVLAPIVPFESERHYQHLVREVDPAAPVSVHLCEYPQSNHALIDVALARQMDAAMSIVSQALSLREGKQLRVRLPLQRLVVVPVNETQAKALERFGEYILDELNIKKLVIAENFDQLLSYDLSLNFKTAGPKFGKQVNAVAAALKGLPASEVAAKVKGGTPVQVVLDGVTHEIVPADIVIKQNVGPEWAVSDEKDMKLALNIAITPDLELEGFARDTVRHIQQMRKEADLNLLDRIRVSYRTDDVTLRSAIERFTDYIKGETLALELGSSGAADKSVVLSGKTIAFGIEKAA